MGDAGWGGGLAQFHIVLSGDAVVETDTGVRRIGPGNLVLFPRGLSHVLADQTGRQAKPGSEVMAALDAGKEPFLGIGAAARLAEVLLVQVLRRFFALNPQHIGFLAGAMDRRLSRAIVKIHREFDQALTVGDLADRAGMSRSGFSEQFKAKTGLAPITYLTKWRMTSAARLLRNRPFRWPRWRSATATSPMLPSCAPSAANTG